MRWSPSCSTHSYKPGWCAACGKFRQHVNGRCAMAAYHPLRACEGCGRQSTEPRCSECVERDS